MPPVFGMWMKKIIRSAILNKGIMGRIHSGRGLYGRMASDRQARHQPAESDAPRDATGVPRGTGRATKVGSPPVRDQRKGPDGLLGEKAARACRCVARDALSLGASAPAAIMPPLSASSPGSTSIGDEAGRPSASAHVMIPDMPLTNGWKDVLKAREIQGVPANSTKR